MIASNQHLRRAKDDWLLKFDGAVKKVPLTFGSPTVRHIHKRSYDQIGRNCHFISVFGRILLGEDKISEPEAAIYSRIQEVTTSLERKIAASKATIVDAGIDDTTTFNKKEEIVSSVIVPAQGKYLKILSLADEFLRLINTLWLEGEITDKAKSKAELELKQNLRIISSTTRKMRLYLQGKLHEAAAKEDATAETKRLASEIKKDEHSIEDINEDAEDSSIAVELAAAA